MKLLRALAAALCATGLSVLSIQAALADPEACLPEAQRWRTPSCAELGLPSRGHAPSRDRRYAPPARSVANPAAPGPRRESGPGLPPPRPARVLRALDLTRRELVLVDRLARDLLADELAIGGVDGECALVQEPGLPAGLYYIAVSDFDTNPEIARYYIQPTSNEAAQDVEPNDSSQTALGPLAGSNRLCGEIGAVHDFDWYSLTVPAGADVRVETIADDGVECPTDSFVELLDTDGATLLVSSDDDGVDTCSLIDPAVDAEAAGLAGGTYYLRVAAFSSNVGPYLLDVTISP